MTNIGYARCSTDEQDLTAQHQQLIELAVSEERIYLDHGLTGTNRNRPELGKALAAVREGDTLIVTKLDRLARSVPDALDILNELDERGVRFALGSSVYDWRDPFAKMFLSILAVIAEFEAGLISQRTKEGMAIARTKGKLKGKPPKLTTQQREALWTMRETGRYNVTELAEMFKISRPTVYRELAKAVTVASM